jgi:hypothetical protein
MDNEVLIMKPEDIKKIVENGQSDVLWNLFLKDFNSAPKYRSRVDDFLKDLNETLNPEDLAHQLILYFYSQRLYR